MYAGGRYFHFFRFPAFQKETSLSVDAEKLVRNTIRLPKLFFWSILLATASQTLLWKNDWSLSGRVTALYFGAIVYSIFSSQIVDNKFARYPRLCAAFALIDFVILNVAIGILHRNSLA